MATVIDRLKEQIALERAAGNYREAAAIATRLLRAVQEDAQHHPRDIEAAERSIRTLLMVGDLPQEEQDRLAEADRLEAEIRQVCSRRDSSRAVDLVERELTIRRSVLGEQHPETAIVLRMLAKVLAQTGNYDRAEDCGRQSMEILTEALGSNHLETARSNDRLGVVLWFRGRYEEAEVPLTSALACRRRLLGDEHIEVAESLHNLALVREDRGDLEAAEACHREALSIRRRFLGSENEEVASNLNNLGWLLTSRGDLDGAESIHREALAIRTSLPEPNPADIAASCGNLAVVLDLKREYAAAEALYRQSLAIMRRALGELHPHYAIILNNLSNLLVSCGDLEGSERLLRRSLAINRRSYGNLHPEIADNLDNLATLLRLRQRPVEVEDLLRESLEILRHTRGESHPEFVRVLNNLGHHLWKEGRRHEATDFFQECLQRMGNSGIEQYRNQTKILGSLGRMCLEEGNVDEACAFLNESVAIERALLGSEHADTMDGLAALAEAHCRRGDHSEAQTLLVQASEVFQRARARVGRGVRRSIVLRSPYGKIAAVHLALGEPMQAWRATERHRSALLGEILTTVDRPSQEEAARERELLFELDGLERQLEAARLQQSSEATARVAEIQGRLIDAEAEWSAFESAMANKYPNGPGQIFEVTRVQSVLESGSAIVGWIDPIFEDFELSGLPSWGFVIRQSGPVLWKKLPLITTIPPAMGARPDSPLRSFRRAVSGPLMGSHLSQESGLDAWKERFQPLMTELDTVSDLIVLPSGPMLGIPVEALPMDEKGSLAGNRFAISYAPSATIYAWLTERSRAREARRIMRNDRRGSFRCLAIGDPTFSPDDQAGVTGLAGTSLSEFSGSVSIFRDGSDVENSSETEPVPEAANSETLLRGALWGSRAALSKLRRLPATRDEVRTIVNCHGPGSRALLGTEASEEELIRMADADELVQFSTLHIATHALVDDEHPERSAFVLSQLDLGDLLEAATSGTRIRKGTVTARDIVRDWKLDADLVALSACNTGLGREVPGEGYIGFAHAFLQVGARSLLVSLWKVEDGSTSLLMQRFYENRFGGYEGARKVPGDEPRAPGEPMSKARALQEAKLWLRKWTDAQAEEPYAHPYYWAGFILIGTRD